MRSEKLLVTDPSSWSSSSFSWPWTRLSFQGTISNQSISCSSALLGLFEGKAQRQALIRTQPYPKPKGGCGWGREPLWQPALQVEGQASFLKRGLPDWQRGCGLTQWAERKARLPFCILLSWYSVWLLTWSALNFNLIIASSNPLMKAPIKV